MEPVTRELFQAQLHKFSEEKMMLSGGSSGRKDRPRVCMLDSACVHDPGQFILQECFHPGFQVVMPSELQCHQQPMTGNGKHPNYGDDWGMVYSCYTHISMCIYIYIFHH